WGDFDISVLDELPPGRRLPRTRLLPAERRGEAWELVCEQLAAGRQAYVVCPAIEESEQEMAATSAVFEELARGPLAHLRLGLVHGRLGPDRRQAVMGAFRAGEIDVLVATSVVEVGVNVPNATTIVIENAERFGLAQLHQLRGRVVRADFQPHCLLICSTPSEDALERLAVLARTADGFEIAEEDLRRRGPGEMEGLRQSGLPELRIAGLLADSAALSEAHADAFEAIGRDPELAREEHAGLREMLHSGPSGETWTL
ncbi:MAG: helicase-related protein, partial [Armatimonadota bacterium]